MDQTELTELLQTSQYLTVSEFKVEVEEVREGVCVCKGNVVKFHTHLGKDT